MIHLCPWEYSWFYVRFIWILFHFCPVSVFVKQTFIPQSDVPVFVGNCMAVAWTASQHSVSGYLFLMQMPTDKACAPVQGLFFLLYRDPVLSGIRSLVFVWDGFLKFSFSFCKCYVSSSNTHCLVSWNFKNCFCIDCCFSLCHPFMVGSNRKRFF